MFFHHSLCIKLQTQFEIMSVDAKDVKKQCDYTLFNCPKCKAVYTESKINVWRVRDQDDLDQIEQTYKFQLAERAITNTL